MIPVSPIDALILADLQHELLAGYLALLGFSKTGET